MVHNRNPAKATTGPVLLLEAANRFTIFTVTKKERNTRFVF